MPKLKIILLVPILLLIFTPAFGQPLSDKTGLVNRLEIKSTGHTFEVETVANFDVANHNFVKDEKRLTIFINSSLENNLGEIIIPKTLLSGNLTFNLDGLEYVPKYRSNDKISFVTLNFTGSGEHKLDIIGEEALPELQETEQQVTDGTDNPVEPKGGCLVATAAFGSELASEVQKLREIRDEKLLKTESGMAFMNSFNSLYYSFSPSVADYERENPFFKEIVKIAITPMISSLSLLNYVEMDSEERVLGFGILVILLNFGMYVGTPVFGVLIVKRKF